MDSHEPADKPFVSLEPIELDEETNAAEDHDEIAGED